MSRPPKKFLEGATARRKPAQKEVRVYDVMPSGSGRSVTYEETTGSRKRRATQQMNPGDNIVLNRTLQEDWQDDPPTAYIPDLPAPTPPEAPGPEAAQLEHLLDDVHETFESAHASGKGQNAMLESWLQEWANFYLDELYEHHSPPLGHCLWCTSQQPANFCCDDCISLPRFCRDCLLAQHRNCPTHRVSTWNGSAWSRTTLREWGVVLILGEHTSPCPQTSYKNFTLGDLTGIHEVKVAFCQCPNAPEHNLQLMRLHIFPCSDVFPSSGFTFSCLRTFQFASTECKMSASRFYSLLQRSTNNILPHQLIDRFREFLRCSRMWMHLQDLKRAGAENVVSPEAEHLALRCPACPRLGVNHVQDDVEAGEEYLYTQQMSYDGSFQLVRKNKAYDSHDVCLSDGTKYWVPIGPYKAHLESKKDDAYQQSTRGTDCNNHRAANDTWVRRAGVAESGVGAVTCARHTLYMPTGMVPYYKGERFAYTDYAIACVIALLFTEGALQLIIFYDIYCHWIKNFWARLADIVLQGIPDDISARVKGGVGKYHIAGHTDQCYGRYSPNHMYGVGRVDAEGCERAWADLNLAARSSSEKGPGARIDSLNSCMQDWNWRKITTLVTFCIVKYAEAIVMAEETEEEWKFFSSSISAETRAEWSTWPTEPYQEPGTNVWKSVFISDEGEATSVTRALMELNRLEALDRKGDRDVASESEGSDQNESGLTAPSWISEGIEIEIQQKRLLNDLKAYGKNPTDKQSLDCFNRRSALSSRIIRHRQSAAFFVDITTTSSGIPGSLAEETDGQPELAPLYLPSRLGDQLVKTTERSRKALGYEYKLRRVTCLRALHRVKANSIQHRNLSRAKLKHAKGQNRLTRAQAVVERLAKRVEFSAWEYRHSRSALEALGFQESDQKLLQELKDSHLKELSSFLDLDRNVGQGYRRIPWLWQLTLSNSTGGTTHPESGSSTSKEIVNVEKEADDANRVEWFRGRERYKRWAEEVKWLRREVASIILDFDSRGREWDQRARSEAAKRSMGYRSYSIRQRDAWHMLRKDALERAHHMLTATPEMAICKRVLTLFSK